MYIPFKSKKVTELTSVFVVVIAKKSGKKSQSVNELQPTSLETCAVWAFVRFQWSPLEVCF